jgi:hypothetical protein
MAQLREDKRSGGDVVAHGAAMVAYNNDRLHPARCRRGDEALPRRSEITGLCRGQHCLGLRRGQHCLRSERGIYRDRDRRYGP